MRLLVTVGLTLASLVLSPGHAAAASAAPDDLTAIVADLAELLEGRHVSAPDGRSVPVLISRRGAEGLLTRERLQLCLETVSEAEAWPAAWLIVQVAELDFDLVLRVALDEAQQISEPEFLFTVPRREWDFDDIPVLAREATGRKPPRKGARNLVIQGFSTRVETTYVYQTRPTEAARGLEALLPPGSIIRDAESVGAGEALRTLALVLHDAIHVPSTCDDCASALFGHADSGKVSLIVADRAKILDRLDLTPHLKGTTGRPLVPRHHCGSDSQEPIPLLKLEDLDGDGEALEFLLPAESIDCERHRSLILQFEPADSSLRILETREIFTGD